MSTAANMMPEPAPILACTISRDIQNFDLLIDDMELELGESWGDLTFDDARDFLAQHPEVGQVPPGPVEVEPIAHHELVGDVEAHEVGTGRDLRPPLLRQEHERPHARRAATAGAREKGTQDRQVRATRFQQFGQAFLAHIVQTRSGPAASSNWSRCAPMNWSARWW